MVTNTDISSIESAIPKTNFSTCFSEKIGEYDIVIEKYDPSRHYIDNIYGRAPFTQGIGEINFHPGLYGKLGFNFEYAPVFEDVKALEIGVILDVYPTEIPIMAFIDNKQFFLSFYITLMYGRKW